MITQVKNQSSISTCLKGNVYSRMIHFAFLVPFIAESTCSKTCFYLQMVSSGIKKSDKCF